MVEVSPWPVVSSFLSLNLMVSFIMFFNSCGVHFFFISVFFLFFFSFFWWGDVERESLFCGFHGQCVKLGLKFGMVMFILSEVMFFLSFFWSFIHSSGAAEWMIGLLWPPFHIFTFDPFGVPLLNTIVLLSSGVTVTWSHHLVLMNSYLLSAFFLLFTIFLGLFFSFLQGFEYLNSSYEISDSVFGSVFFMATGFHGLHVLVGSTFLLFSFMKLFSMNVSFIQNVGFECAAWYWHFVDVVWLFLYSLVYWWGQ